MGPKRNWDHFKSLFHMNDAFDGKDSAHGDFEWALGCHNLNCEERFGSSRHDCSSGPRSKVYSKGMHVRAPLSYNRCS